MTLNKLLNIGLTDEQANRVLKYAKRESLDDQLLTEAQARNVTAVRAFLPDISDDVDDEMFTSMRKQQLDALKGGDDTAFLFGEAKKPAANTFVGQTPTKGTLSVDVNPFVKEHYDERAQTELYRQNPDMARAMAKKAGIGYIG